MSLSELRSQINWSADDTTHDAVLSRLAAAATARVERFTRRSLMTQTWTLTTRVAPLIELPRPPLQSVTSIEVLNSAGETETVDAEDYRVVSSNHPGAIRMINSWPGVYPYELEPVTIIYVAGYGDEPSDVPEELRLAIMQLVAFQFELGRGDMPGDIPDHIKASLESLRSGTGAGYFGGVV